MFDFEDNSNGTEEQKAKSLLEKFVKDSQKFVRELLEDGKGLIPGLAERVRSAWNSGDFQKRFENLIDSIRERRSLSLEEHGLMKGELEAKLGVVSHFYGEYEESTSGKERGTLKRLLESVRTVMDSLLQATKLGTAISEMIGIISIMVLDD